MEAGIIGLIVWLIAGVLGSLIFFYSFIAAMGYSMFQNVEGSRKSASRSAWAGGIALLITIGWTILWVVMVIINIVTIVQELV